VELVGIAGFLGALLMGFYLFCSTYFFHIHYNEAFSSFRYEGYKNFLRIHVTPAQVTVYPIGVRQVTTDWHVTADENSIRVTGKSAPCELIEQPVCIPLFPNRK